MPQAINSAIRALFRHPPGFPQFGVCMKNLGFLNYMRAVAFCHQAQRQPTEEIAQLRSRHAKYPLGCRRCTSDFKVFGQIFIEREYSCLDELRDIHTIIDCGANVGYSSAYFLTRFPQARLISVEPDDANFELLKRNTARYGSRVELIKSALWSHPAKLRMSTVPYRDGNAWARQVCECGPGETGFGAVDLNQLIDRFRSSRIDLLKIDVEGAEAVVFARNYKSWLERVDTLVIELHDDSMFGDGRSLVKRVMAEESFSELEFGELSVFRRT